MTRRRPSAYARESRPAPPAPGALPLRHPGVWIAALVAALSLVVSTSFPIGDPDVWQHLAVGRAIVSLGHVPAEHLWTWPSYDAPGVTPSWAFRVLIWLCWRIAEVPGLFAWRWLTTLLAFGFAWAAARRMGARGLTPLVVIVLCGLVYRQRAQVRPETLVAVLMAAQIWLLAATRERRPRSAEVVALVAIAWLWANAHMSYFLGLMITGIHLIAAWIAERRGRTPAAAGASPPLLLALLASVAISFVNPYGAAALWQPFAYLLEERQLTIYRTIGELHPVDWAKNLRNGLPLLVAGWPLLLLWRARRAGLDLVEVALCLVFTVLALRTQRFLGLYAVAAAPYLARDLDGWVRTWRLPAWAAPPWRRAALAALACATIGIPEWLRPDVAIRVGLESIPYPRRAADFMAEHGVRGRGFNPYFLGGYMLWRFWPDRARLPFMDIHQTGSREDREMAIWSLLRPEAWRDLDRKHRFDYVLTHRQQPDPEVLLDVLDADTTWTLVFLDDAAALYVRRDGPLASVGHTYGYRLLPASVRSLPELGRRAARDPAFRAALRAEAERERAGSPHHAEALRMLADLDMLDRRPDRARERLLAIARMDPRYPGVHGRLGRLALVAGQPREALESFRRERAISGTSAEVERRTGEAWEALGDRGRAASAYRRALAADPGDEAARAALVRMGGTP